MPEKTPTQTQQKISLQKKPLVPQEAAPLQSEADYLAASPAITRLAAGELPPVEPQKHVLAINRVAGNRAAARQVMRSRKPPAAIQRDDEPTGTWNMPLELGPVSDKTAARTAIGVIISDMTELLTELGGESPVDNPIPALQEKQGALTGSGLLTQTEANDLNALTTRVQVGHDLMIMQIQQAVASGMSQLSTMPDSSTAETQLSDALAKQSHTSFKSGEGEDKLAPIKDALTKVKEYNKKCGEVADYARKAADAVKLVKTASALKAFKSASGNLGTVLGKVLTVADTASQIATVAGFNQQKAGAMDQSINQLRNGVALAGAAMTLFKGVPLIGAYWSNWVVPLTDACLQGLEKLTDIGEKIGLESILDSEPGPGGAPVIDPLQMQYFPGGQAMLDFMFVLVNGGTPAMPSSVRDYFYQMRKQFNAGNEEQMPDKPSMLNPVNWFFDDTSLFEWVQRNRDMIWAQLYGGLPHSLRR